MDIVDAQVHANVLGTEVTLAIMDALGIQAVLVDEYLAPDGKGGLLPGYPMANGVLRPVGPNAEAAALGHPERFGFLMRVEALDPRIESWIETVAVSPNLKALRTVTFTPAEGEVFESGGHDRLLKAAQAHNLPVFVTCPSRVPLLARYAEKFPDISFIIDHCGVAFDAPRGTASLDDTVAMARYPNVALKWAHAPSFLSVEPYPFADLEPKLRRVVDAFGPKRVMWASDYTVSRRRQSWAESLFCIRHSPSLSEADKEWILGRTARTLLRWPAPEKPFKPGALHPRRWGPAE
jgi:predicted TIM-barrel fold metal-dependent hydrolase